MTGEGNQNTLKHGGEAAVKAIQKGEPLRGLAAQAEQDVITELSMNGVLSLIRRDVTRVQAATDLFWNAIQKAAEEDDLKALDHYIARFGWLAGVSLRALLDLRKEERTTQRETLNQLLGKVIDDREA